MTDRLAHRPARHALAVLDASYGPQRDYTRMVRSVSRRLWLWIANAIAAASNSRSSPTGDV